MKKTTMKPVAKKQRDMTEYTIEEAIANLKEGSREKFDATVELHLNLKLDVKKPDQAIRFTTSLPHGTGKTVRVAALTADKVAEADLLLKEDDIAKLEKSEIRPKIDFDVLVTEPKYMPKLAKAAKVLGPAGVMPNPKNGTVTDNIAQAINEIKKGKIEIRTEKEAPAIHTLIGKTSFDAVKLVENYTDLIKALVSNKPNKAKPDWMKNAFVTTSMGRSYRIKLS